MEKQKNLCENTQMLNSLNSSLFDEIAVNELEERLETDPLAIGQLFNLTSSDDVTRAEGCCLFAHCNTDE